MVPSVELLSLWPKHLELGFVVFAAWIKGSKRKILIVILLAVVARTDFPVRPPLYRRLACPPGCSIWEFANTRDPMKVRHGLEVQSPFVCQLLCGFQL